MRNSGKPPKAGIGSLVLLLSASLFSCPYPESHSALWPPPDDWHRYDPRWAGAELVLSRDITENFPDCVSVNLLHYVSSNRHNIAVHGDYVYIAGQWLIHVFDKNTFEYRRTIEMRRFSFFSVLSRFGGLVVTDDFAIALFNTPAIFGPGEWPPGFVFPQYTPPANPPPTYIPPPWVPPVTPLRPGLIEWPFTKHPDADGFIHAVFLFVDMDTGELEVVNAGEMLGLPLRTRMDTIIGFDKKNELFWLRSGGFGDSVFHFFQYDRKNRSFVPYREKDGFSVGHGLSHHAQRVAIHGSSAWAGFVSDIVNTRMGRYDFASLPWRRQFIDIIHLGLHRYVQHLPPTRFAYDGEHIYIAVMDRLDGYRRVNLLKIRPLADEGGSPP